MKDNATWDFRNLNDYFSPVDWTALLLGLSHDHGSIELQNDQPHKEFPWHQHDCDEKHKALHLRSQVPQGNRQVPLS